MACHPIPSPTASTTHTHNQSPTPAYRLLAAARLPKKKANGTHTRSGTGCAAAMHRTRLSQYCQETLFPPTPFLPLPGLTSAERNCAGPDPEPVAGTVSFLPCSTSCTWDELCRCSSWD